MDLNTAVLLIIIPLIISAVNIALPKILQKGLTFAGLIFQLYLVYYLYQGHGSIFYLFSQPILSTDELGLFTVIFIQILSLIIFIFSLKGLDSDSERKFHILYPAAVAVSNGVVLSGNIISFLIFWGMSGLALYLFAILGKTHDTPKTAKKTFIIVGGSDVFLIMGLIIILHLLPDSSWNMNDIHLDLSTGLSYTAFFCLLIAAFAKAGGFPLHTWVPDFCIDAPVESAALLPSSLDKLLGIYLMARIMINFFTVPFIINLIIITLGSLTVIIAVMMAMNQHNGRRLLGYHAVSQVGYMIIGVGSGNALAFAGGLFHLVNNTIYKSNLFLTLGAVEKAANTSELDYLGGLGKKMPVTFIIALIGTLSISGIPPFNGFFSKWMIYQGLLQTIKDLSPMYQIWLLICIILALFGSALTLASFIKFLHSIFLGRRPTVLDNVKEAPLNQLFSMSVLSILCILFGLFAVEIPLKFLINPVVSASGYTIPDFVGLYNPVILLFLFALLLALCFIISSFTIKPRYDEVYIGGMTSSEKFRITGTEFYNEVITMKPLKYLFSWAGKKYFDIYELGAKVTFGFSALLQKAHPGLLQLYVLYIIAGLMIFILLIQ